MIFMFARQPRVADNKRSFLLSRVVRLLHADKLLFAFNYGFLLEYFWTFTLIYNPTYLYVQPYETEITSNSIIPLRMNFCYRQNLDLISFN